MVCFHWSTPIPIPMCVPTPIVCRSAPLGQIPMVIPMMIPMQNYLINTDISVKLGTVAIGIRIGIGIVLRVGSVQTVLCITIVISASKLASEWV